MTRIIASELLLLLGRIACFFSRVWMLIGRWFEAGSRRIGRAR